jgi:Calcineurin-like phosphoesterase
MRINFIGDVHGHTDRYQKILRRNFAGQRTFQLGDMGVGFPTYKGREGGQSGGLHPHIMNSGDHKWIRGNHDNPEVARRLTDRGYAGDYGYDPEIGLFWMGGAYSIDKAWRVPGKNWWAEEEISYPELAKIIDFYERVKPKIVATHDCPSRISEYMLTVVLPSFRPEKLECVGSRTAAALQQMLDVHRPTEWVFGHYHASKSFVWKGTKFTCVGELDVYTISDEPLIVTPNARIIVP